MPSFSDVRFTSVLAYPPKSAFPHPQFQLQREKVLSIKDDRTLPNSSPPTPAIAYFAEAVCRHMQRYEVLRDCFEGALTAVPVPRSKLQQPNSLWPALRICEELKAVGLVTDIAPFLRRTRAVLPSHHSSSADTRASPEQHYETMAVDLGAPHTKAIERLLIVDDIVTRGSTFLACQALLQESFPFHPISAFAVASTVSGSPRPILQPVCGVCSCPKGFPFRDP
jgi:hypothetical protein